MAARARRRRSRGTPETPAQQELGAWFKETAAQLEGIVALLEDVRDGWIGRRVPQPVRPKFRILDGGRA
jgi:hypothetical protein